MDALWVIEAHQSAWQLSYWIQNAIFQVSTYRGIPYQRQSPTTVWENVAEAEVRPSRVRWSNLREDFEMLIWRSSSHPSVPTFAIAFLHPACYYFMREAHICVRAYRTRIRNWYVAKTGLYTISVYYFALSTSQIRHATFINLLFWIWIVLFMIICFVEMF